MTTTITPFAKQEMCRTFFEHNKKHTYIVIERNGRISKNKKSILSIEKLSDDTYVGSYMFFIKKGTQVIDAFYEGNHVSAFLYQDFPSSGTYTMRIKVTLGQGDNYDT